MQKKSHLGLIVVVAALLTCACIGVATWLVLSNSHVPINAERQKDSFESQSFAQGESEVSVQDSEKNAEGDLSDRSAGGSGDAGVSRVTAQGGAHDNKLSGAVETVDENGVVHGTSAGGISYVLYGRGQSGAEKGKVSFAAVGDVFATNMNMPILDSYSGQTGDGVYEFGPYYRAVSQEIGARDIRFINQETPCAGTDDGREYTGYPVFNTPDSSIHALANAGFNVANFNSNHTWDMGEYGILRSHGLFAEHPGVMLIGSYASPEDRSCVRMIERNQTTVALLSYCYGDNWYGAEPGAFPNNYYTCQFDKSVMAGEIARAQEVADAVVVYMHWGSEYVTDPNDQQLEYAQFLADLGVDVVVGSHAHIMQPIRYVDGAGGKRVPVVFGLSDFITGWTITDTILSGMFSCDFVWRDGQLVVENCAYMPAIEWSDGGDTYVRFLKDMTSEEIDANTRTPDVDGDAAYLRSFIDGLGMEVPVVW